MRLTKSDKEAFVRAVMDDVPNVDYHEQVRSKLKAWGIESLPEEMRPLAKKYPDYFNAHYIGTPAYCPSVKTICDPNWSWSGFQEREPAKYAELVALGELEGEQQKTRDALRRKITGLINECSTLKTAQQRLPEFVKYLPAERDVTGTVNLPVANVLAELTNLGWPKGEPYAAAV